MRVGSFCAAAPRVIVLAIAALVLAGCTRSQPHGVAERYIEDLQQFNYDATYHLLSAQDRKDRTLREFLTEIPLAPEASPIWFRPVLHKMHYELGPERRNNDGVTATVPVRITMPDLPLWERVMDAAAGPGDIGAERAQRSLDTGDYPKVTTTTLSTSSRNIITGASLPASVSATRSSTVIARPSRSITNMTSPVRSRPTSP